MVYMIGRNEIHVLATTPQLFVQAAVDFRAKAQAAVNERGVFKVALSGGKTPKTFFDTLSQAPFKQTIPWSAIHFFFGDERYVAADDVMSNFNTANEHLFSKLPIKKEHIFRMPTEIQPPQAAADQYAMTLQREFNLGLDNPFPAFDLIYLGLGDNSHTASLMPNSPFVQDYVQNSHKETDMRLVVPIFDEVTQLERLTLTPNAINASQAILYLINGGAKADAVNTVIKGPQNPVLYPAQLIQSSSGKTQWFLDESAAAKLSRS